MRIVTRAHDALADVLQFFSLGEDYIPNISFLLQLELVKKFLVGRWVGGCIVYKPILFISRKSKCRLVNFFGVGGIGLSNKLLIL